MRKKVDKKSGMTTYLWSPDSSKSMEENIQDQIKKCEKDISGYMEFLDYWKWNYEKAKKEYEFRVNKIEDLRVFKNLLTKRLQGIQDGTLDEDGNPINEDSEDSSEE